MVYSQNSDTHYLITEHQNFSNMLTGLKSGEYSVLLYTIDEHGIPLKQPAGFPQTVDVHQNSSAAGKLQCIFNMSQNHIFSPTLIS